MFKTKEKSGQTFYFYPINVNKEGKALPLTVGIHPPCRLHAKLCKTKCTAKFNDMVQIDALTLHLTGDSISIKSNLGTSKSSNAQRGCISQD